MRQDTLFYVVLISAILTAGCGNDTSDPRSQSEEVQAVVQGNSAFAIDLYQQLRHADGNLFFSPYSISTAFAMTYAGARGETEKQMAQTLHFSLDQETLHPALATVQASLNQSNQAGATLHIANSLWPRNGHALLDNYLSLTKKCYGVSISPVDYAQPQQASDTINQWIRENTAGKIDQVLAPGAIDDLTEMILVNAIYFKGTWQHQFHPGLTGPNAFYLTNETPIKTPMMMQTAKVLYAETNGLQILQLPYDGARLSMLVLLPQETEGLARLEMRLSAENIERWKAQLGKTKVRIGLPKFTLRASFRLDETLKTMGMTEAFAWPGADFSGLTGAPDLYLNMAIHSAFVEVNEEGTEAAATTIVGAVRSRGRRTGPPRFWADHPFLFLIQEHSTGTILFIGRVIDPSKGQ